MNSHYQSYWYRLTREFRKKEEWSKLTVIKSDVQQRQTLFISNESSFFPPFSLLSRLGSGFRPWRSQAWKNSAAFSVLYTVPRPMSVYCWLLLGVYSQGVRRQRKYKPTRKPALFFPTSTHPPAKSCHLVAVSLADGRDSINWPARVSTANLGRQRRAKSIPGLTSLFFFDSVWSEKSTEEQCLLRLTWSMNGFEVQLRLQWAVFCVFWRRRVDLIGLQLQAKSGMA